MNKKGNVTFIEDLIDLDDIQGGGQNNFSRQMMSESQERENYAKPLQNKLRTNVDFMTAVNGGRPPMNDFLLVEPNEEYQMGPRAIQRTNYRQYSNPNIYEENYIPHMGGIANLSCIDISHHIKNCPICSKLYDNDKSIYIIGIVVLIIICIILLKKILENSK